MFCHLNGTFRDLVCQMNSTNVISLCRYFWQRFWEEMGFGSGPGITDELAFLPLAHYRWIKTPPVAPSRLVAGIWVVWTAGIWLHEDC